MNDRLGQLVVAEALQPQADVKHVGHLGLHAHQALVRLDVVADAALG